MTMMMLRRTVMRTMTMMLVVMMMLRMVMMMKRTPDVVTCDNFRLHFSRIPHGPHLGSLGALLGFCLGHASTPSHVTPRPCGGGRRWRFDVYEGEEEEGYSIRLL